QKDTAVTIAASKVANKICAAANADQLTVKQLVCALEVLSKADQQDTAVTIAASKVKFKLHKD
uniref:hypothetical protein n=1 Tax=Parendozoicomonas sp. Alg238-R29 TaxID=2993446 RepID=UPI00248F049A